MKFHNFFDHFIEGTPDQQSVLSMIDNNAHTSKSSAFQDHQLFIVDDLLCDIVTRKEKVNKKLFTVYSNYKKVTIIMLSQMLFKP